MPLSFRRLRHCTNHRSVVFSHTATSSNASNAFLIDCKVGIETGISCDLPHPFTTHVSVASFHLTLCYACLPPSTNNNNANTFTTRHALITTTRDKKDHPSELYSASIQAHASTLLPQCRPSSSPSLMSSPRFLSLCGHSSPPPVIWCRRQHLSPSSSSQRLSTCLSTSAKVLSILLAELSVSYLVCYCTHFDSTVQY